MSSKPRWKQPTFIRDVTTCVFAGITIGLVLVILGKLMEKL